MDWRDWYEWLNLLTILSLAVVFGWIPAIMVRNTRHWDALGRWFVFAFAVLGLLFWLGVVGVLGAADGGSEASREAGVGRVALLRVGTRVLVCVAFYGLAFALKRYAWGPRPDRIAWRGLLLWWWPGDLRARRRRALRRFRRRGDGLDGAA